VELREGGGKRSLLGLPFFLAGLYAVLTAAGILPAEDMPDGLWAAAVAGLLSLTFLGVGSVVLFGRRWVQFDPASGTLTRSYGLLFPLLRQQRRLGEFAAVVIAFEPGDSESPERYPVRLRASSGKDFPVSAPERFGESRRQAEFLSRLLRLPLADTTTDHEVLTNPERAGETLQQRLRSAGAKLESGRRPAEMICQVSESAGQATIVIPARKSPFVTVVLASVSGVALFFAPALWRLFRQTETPPALALPFFVLTLLGFGILPLAAAVNRMVRTRKDKTVVTASPSGLIIERRGAWRTETTTLSAGDILDVDHSTFDGTLQSARRAAGIADIPAPASDGTPQFAALKQWIPAKGIIVKSRHGLIAFGEGLPADELRFLKGVVSKALSAQGLETSGE
jgi:hypothetical protein